MKDQYSNIARKLASEIEKGKYNSQTLFPKRSELAARFEVTRSTIDRAVRVLADRGYLESRRGAGTVVCSVKPKIKTAYIAGNYGMTFTPFAQELDLTNITYDDIQTKSARDKLRSFDCIIWHHPSKESIEWCREFPEDLPQILINRHLKDFNYVSTDHMGAIYKITSQRLADHKDAVPVYLGLEGRNDVVTAMRYDGFVAACRERKVFYETLQLPDDFESSIQSLEKLSQNYKDKKLLLVSGNRAVTGAVMTWVREKGLKWQENVFYSDFDNSYTPDVWGVKVTSFVQDEKTISRLTFEKAAQLIKGEVDSVQELVPAEFIDGDT
ncbi:MAG: GntR family transcriptional regulator [Planctomycetota bacterium]|jgi:DNA-binding LacI/PurR family transcriptional regulator